MEKSLRSLLSLSGQLVAYGIGFVGRQLVTLITLPLITNLVSQKDFGIISIITSFYLVCNTITNMGLPSATFRFYNDNKDPNQQKEVIGTSQTLFFLLAFVLAVIIVAFSGSVSNLLLGSRENSLVIQLVALLVVVETMNYYGAILLRLHNRPGAVSVHNLVSVVGQMGLALIFIKIFESGVLGYWLGFVLGALISLVFMIWLNRKVIVFTFSLSSARELLAYGIPLVPASLSITLLLLTDRFFLRTFLSLDVVAVYAIGYKVGSLVNLLMAPFQIAWPNFAFSSIKNPDASRIYRDVTTLIVLGCSIFTLGTYIFRYQIIDLLSPESYRVGADIVPWISASMILLGLNPVVSLGPKIKKDTRPLAWISVATTLVNILILMIFIPRWGIVGAAIGTFLSYLFLTVASYVISLRYFYFPLDWKRIGIIVITVLGLGLLNIIAEAKIPDLSNLILVQALILLAFPLLLILMKIIPVKEVVQILKENTEKFFSKIS